MRWVAVVVWCSGAAMERSYLGSLRLDLTGTSEGTVNLTHVVDLWELLDDLKVMWDACRWRIEVSRCRLFKVGSKLIAKKATRVSSVVQMSWDERWAYSRWRKLSSFVLREERTRKSDRRCWTRQPEFSLSKPISADPSWHFQVVSSVIR